MLKNIAKTCCLCAAVSMHSLIAQAAPLKLTTQQQATLEKYDSCTQTGQPTLFDKQFDLFLKQYGFYNLESNLFKTKQRFQVISEKVTAEDRPVKYFKTEFKEGFSIYHFENFQEGNQGVSQIEFTGKQLEFAPNIKIGASKQAVFDAFGGASCLNSNGEDHLGFDYYHDDSGESVHFIFDQQNRLRSISHSFYAG